MATDVECLELVIEKSVGGPVAKRLLRQKLYKLLRSKPDWQAFYDSLTYEIRYNLAAARVYLGDYSNWTGWIYRSKWAMESHWIERDIPKWRGENVKRLYVVGEQGIGDEILYASCLPECMVRCNHITWTCDERLRSVFQRSFPGVEFIPRSEEEDAAGHDAYIGAGDLFPLFRRAAGHFPGKPYLRPREPDPVCRAYQGRVGVGWAGRQGALDPLRLGIENPLSLQHSATHPGIEPPHSQSGPIDLKDDLESVLSLVAVLERVVCVPSSIHHIAGAAGVKTQIIWPDRKTEERDVIPWSVPPGKLPWYKDATVYKSVMQWRRDGCTRPVGLEVPARVLDEGWAPQHHP